MFCCCWWWWWWWCLLSVYLLDDSGERLKEKAGDSTIKIDKNRDTEWEGYGDREKEREVGGGGGGGGETDRQTERDRHCFEGNLGKTAERRGGACMGLSERYNAISS